MAATLILMLILGAIGTVMLLVGSILLLVAAFRRGAGWGLAVFFVPFASIVFAVKYWAEARAAFLVQTGGTVLLILALMAGGFGFFQQFKDSGLPLAGIISESKSPVGAEEPDGTGIPATTPATSGKYVGRPLHEVRRELGPPRAVIRSGDQTLYRYDQVELISADGKTVTEEDLK